MGERVGELRSRIAVHAGGRPVRIVAVTKGFGAEVVAATVAAGICDIGENYAQELRAKATSAPGQVSWHFLGAPQTNKISGLAPLVSVWEAVDRLAAGQAIARHRPGAAAFVEVNVAADPRRPGCDPSAAPGLVAALCSFGLAVRGLMAVAPGGDRGAARRVFRRLAAMGHDLGLPELSMGMSDDFEEAVEEGATSVRLGRALFGPRPGTSPSPE
ncbi:MAG: YggS family pyridoxal phosphate enzyme [Acidimicrobiales bacterium]